MATRTIKIGLSTTDKANMVNQIKGNVLSSLIEPFSTIETYTTDDFVVYNNTLYKFTSSKSAGDWDSTKAQVATLNDIISGSGGGGGTALYNHSIQVEFYNNCTETHIYTLKYQSSSATQITTEAEFKALFSEYLNPNGTNGEENLRTLPFPCRQYYNNTINSSYASNVLIPVDLVYDEDNDYFTYYSDFNGPSTFIRLIGDTVTNV